MGSCFSDLEVKERNNTKSNIKSTHQQYGDNNENYYNNYYQNDNCNNDQNDNCGNDNCGNDGGCND